MEQGWGRGGPSLCRVSCVLICTAEPLSPGRTRMVGHLTAMPDTRDQAHRVTATLPALSAGPTPVPFDPEKQIGQGNIWYILCYRCKNQGSGARSAPGYLGSCGRGSTSLPAWEGSGPWARGPALLWPQLLPHLLCDLGGTTASVASLPLFACNEVPSFSLSLLFSFSFSFLLPPPPLPPLSPSSSLSSPSLRNGVQRAQSQLT